MALAASTDPSADSSHYIGEASSSTNYTVTVNHISHISPSTSIPAPSFSDDRVCYPAVDSSPPLDTPSPSPVASGKLVSANIEKNTDGNSSNCVICLDAPSEAACVPCGHVAGCMSCLNEIKSKKWGCPVCRANIDQVIRLYLV